MQNELLKMIDTGIIGFKCFLCSSGVDEFPCVNMKEVELALHILENSGAALAVSMLIHDFFFFLFIIQYLWGNFLF